MDTISKRYAKALIEIAIEESKVYEYQSQMKIVHSVIKENSELVTFLKHNSIKDNDKKSLIEKIFKDNISILYIRVGAWYNDGLFRVKSGNENRRP